MEMQVSASQNPPPAPFSPPSASASSNNGPRAQNRLSGELRSRGSNPPLPVPSGTPSAQNGHSRNLSGYDMAARSPPNQSSKNNPWWLFLRFFTTYCLCLLRTIEATEESKRV